MQHILSKYVLREFLIPLTYCIIGFLGIYVIFELFDSFNRIMESKPPLSDVLNFFAGYISPYLEWLIPAALLLGTLYTMWTFCRHSEITAMRASGIGFSVIVRPILMVSAVLALGIASIEKWVLHSPEASFLDTIGIFIAIGLATLVGFFSERKSAREFDLLNIVKDDITVKALRNGQLTELHIGEVVVGVKRIGEFEPGGIFGLRDTEEVIGRREASRPFAQP